MIDLKREQAVWLFHQGYWRLVFFKWVSGQTCFFGNNSKYPATLSAHRNECYTSARAALNAALSKLDPRNQIRFVANQICKSLQVASPFPQNLLICRLRSMGAQEGLVKDVLEGQITGEDVLDVLIRQNAEESL
ncbi:hypothetical protein V0M98_37605 (plasmid) [Pseudomonas silesiensis]|uniref:hypothetical protein n=1 Tax=Pseudomonas silesiensis TaxID=1853130 RepID=UPI0030D41B4A